MGFEALAKLRPSIELAAFARNFKLAGGPRDVWIAAWDDAPAPELGSPGQHTIVGNDQPARAGAPLQNLQGKGHAGDAKNGQSSAADALQPSDGLDKGQGRLARDGQRSGADVQPANPLQSKGQFIAASDGHGPRANALQPRRVSPVPPREPSDAYRRALAESRKKSATILLEVRMTRTTNVPWGSVRPREFPAYIGDGDICWGISEAFGPFSEKQKDMQLREFLPDHIFRKALLLAEVNHDGRH
jgi:hypothetical protein